MKKVLSCFLAVAMLVSSLSFPVTAHASEPESAPDISDVATKDDTIVSVVDTTLLNAMKRVGIEPDFSVGGASSILTGVSNAMVPKGDESLDSIKILDDSKNPVTTDVVKSFTYDLEDDIPSAYGDSKLSSNTTLQSRIIGDNGLNGVVNMSLHSDGNVCTVDRFTYQGTGYSVNLRIPDYIRCYVIGSVNEIEDTSKYRVNVVSYTFAVNEISTAFSMSKDGDSNFNSSCTDFNLYVPKRVNKIDRGAFINNTKLNSVRFSGAIQSIGENAFNGCTRLKNLDLNALFDSTYINEIPEGCFKNCTALENIVIPDTIRKIGSEAFAGCDQIDTLKLSDKIKSAGKDAFSWCTGLRYLWVSSPTQADGSSWDSIISEKDKLVVGAITSEPLVTNKLGYEEKTKDFSVDVNGIITGGTTSVGSNVLYSKDKNEYIISGRIDLKYDTVRVESIEGDNKVPLTSYTNESDYDLGLTYKKTFVKTYGYTTRGISFKVQRGKTYRVAAEDSTGNKVNTSFTVKSYTSDDVIAPNITIRGIKDDGSIDSTDSIYSCYKRACIYYSDSESYVATVELDSKPIDLVSNPVSINVMEVGTHTVKVTDGFGNTTVKEFTIDCESPYVKSGLDNGATYSNDVVFQVSDNEGGCGVARVLVDGKVLSSKENVDIKVTESGNHTIVIMDKAGNTSTYEFVLDKIGPRFTGMPEDNGYTKRDVRIGVSSIVGISTIRVEYRSFSDETDDYLASNEDLLSKEGTYRIYVTDKLSNSISKEFTLDKTSPKIDGVSDGEYINSLVDTDKIVKITDNSGSDLTVSLNGESKSSKEFYGSSIPDGKVTITVADKSGNEARLSFVNDTIEPTITGLVEDKLYYNDVVSLGVSDKNLDKVTVNGSEVQLINGCFTATNDGEYHIVATDKSGNKSEATFVVDKTTPIISGVSDGDIYKSGKGIRISVEDTNFDYLSINGSKQTDVSYRDFDTYASNGEYVIEAGDKAGNISKQIRFTIDKDAPEISGISADEYYNTASDLTYVISDNDTLRSVKVNGVFVFGSDQTQNQTGDQLQEYKGVLKEDGNYTIEATDNAGNTAKVSCVLDRKAPEIKGVENLCYYNDKEPIEIIAEDDNFYYMEVNSERVMSDTYIVPQLATNDGNFSVVAYDKAGNSTRIEFYKDTVAPVIKGVDNKGRYNSADSISVYADDDNFDYLVVNGKKYLESSYNVQKDGVYTIEAYDKAGNMSKVTFTKDSVAPKVNVKDKAVLRKPFKVTITDKVSGISTIKYKRGTGSYKTLKNNTILKSDGKYVIKVTDKCKNMTKISFTLDTKAPTFSVKNGKYVKLKTTVKVSDKTSGLSKLVVKLNNKTIFSGKKSSIKLSKVGAYTLTATDKAGNKSVVKVIVPTPKNSKHGH